MGACGSSNDKGSPRQQMGRAGGSDIAEDHILGMGDMEDNPLDPKDFECKKLRGETIVRAPGQLKSQAFTIDECKRCEFFLFDNSAAVTIDDCCDCTFYIGPCESSVFIRDCKRCRLVVACRQFRTRQCSDLHVMLFCAAGQPIIETSTNIAFASFNLSYKSLPAQFKAANMSVWDTEWSNVYDFTKHGGSGEAKEDDKSNWSFLPPTTRAVDLLGKHPHEVCKEIKEEEAKNECPVPPSWGIRPLPKPLAGWKWEHCFILAQGSATEVLKAIRDWVSQGTADIHIKRSRTRTLSTADLNMILGAMKMNYKNSKEKELYIGIELVGRDCIKRCTEKFPAVRLTSTEEVAVRAAATYFDALAQM